MAGPVDIEVGMNRLAYLAFSLAMLAVTLVPFLSVGLVPLLDYPNHLARAYVLEHLDDVPAFAAAYTAAWGVLPNIAMDLILAALLPLVGLEAASRILVVVMVVVWHLGAHVLAREIHGRPSWLAPLIAMFLFSYTLFLGYVNYLTGIAAFFFAFAAWLRCWRHGGGVATFLACALAVVTYLFHLSAYGVLGVAIVSWLVLHRPGTPRRRWLLALSPLVLPLVLFLGFPVLGAPGEVLWAPAETARFVLRFLRTYDLKADVILVGWFFAALALAVQQSRLRPHRDALLVAGALLLAFLVTPYLWDGVWLSMRFLLPGAALAFLSFRIDVKRQKVRWALGLAAGALVARVIFITWVWSGLDAKLARYVDHMRHIPEGARVYPIAFEPFGGDNERRTYAHMHHYAGIYRHAVVDHIFAKVGQHPLRVKPRSPSISRAPADGVAPEQVDWRAIFAGHDTVWLFAVATPYRDFLSAHCRTVFPEGEVVIYRDCQAP